MEQPENIFNIRGIKEEKSGLSSENITKARLLFGEELDNNEATYDQLEEIQKELRIFLEEYEKRV